MSRSAGEYRQVESSAAQREPSAAGLITLALYPSKELDRISGVLDPCRLRSRSLGPSSTNRAHRPAQASTLALVSSSPTALSGAEASAGLAHAPAVCF